MARIVIVDDSPVNSLPLSRLLRYGGHDVECILRSTLALDKLHESRPDLLLLDVGMPGISGMELLRMIRADAGLGDLRVIMYSAMSDPRILHEAEELGALDYLVKGASWEELIMRIEAHVG